MTLEVGQKLWLMPNRVAGSYFGIGSREVTVTRVGRAWAELDNGHLPRIGTRSLALDGAGSKSPGQCYRTQAECEAYMSGLNTWRQLRDFFQADKPHHVTAHDLLDIAALLRMNINKAA